MNELISIKNEELEMKDILHFVRFLYENDVLVMGIGASIMIFGIFSRINKKLGGK